MCSSRSGAGTEEVSQRGTPRHLWDAGVGPVCWDILAMVQTPVTSHTNLGRFHLGPVSSPEKEERRIIKDVNEVATHTQAPHT